MTIWYHVPTPGDHYSPKTGSAVITVIHQLSLFHHPGTKVFVHRGTMDGYHDGERIEVNYSRTGTPPGWAKILDRVWGVWGDGRPLSGTTYTTIGQHLGKTFDGIVFLHNEPAAIDVILAHSPNARCVLWIQNDLFKTYTNRQIRRVVDSASATICCSNYIRQGIVRRIGESAKLASILNGVDTSEFRPNHEMRRAGKPVVLFVGRVVPQKGAHLLLQAAADLKQKGVDFCIRMVGSSGFTNSRPLTTYETDLRSLTKELGGNVEFLGFLNRHEITSQFQSADIFCAPSTWDDPCPLTVLEAMASGLAVVGTNRGGIPEEIGDAGLVVKDDAQSISKALQSLLESKEDRESLGTAARLRSEQMSWSCVYHQVRQLLENL